MMTTAAQAEPGAGRSWALFVAEHCETIWGLAAETQSQIRRSLDRFGALIMPESPGSVRFVDVERFVASLQAAGLTPATINKYLRNLNSVLNAGVDRGYLPNSPIRRRHFQRVPHKIIRVINSAEQAALLAACPTEQWRTFLHMLLATGVRLNQLRPVSWADFELGDQPTLRVVPQKCGCERLLPLSAETLQRLRRLQAMTMTCGGPFIGLGNTRAVQRAFCNIVARSGIRRCTLHDMRRTFCSRLAELGVNQFIVQTLAGHANAATTARYYQHIQQDVQRAAIEVLAKDMAG